MTFFALRQGYWYTWRLRIAHLTELTLNSEVRSERLAKPPVFDVDPSPCLNRPGPAMINLAETFPQSHTSALVDITHRTMSLAKGILADQSRDLAFEPDDALLDIGLSSLDLVNLMISLEVEFDVMIPSTQINPQNFRSVQSIAIMVLALKN
ncbi:phosphopantetheine-binding protein [Methylobacterium nonmethylotrophicum]|nr:phosphopantetheine-binding protein [Methylobacterium nonmethylotrophicum]